MRLPEFHLKVFDLQVRVNGDKALARFMGQLNSEKANEYFGRYNIELNWEKSEGDWFIRTIDINWVDEVTD